MINEIKGFEQRKQDLVKKGKEKGFSTYEDLAESLKGLELDADSLDELYTALTEQHIAVVSADEGGEDDSGNALILDDNTLTQDSTLNDPVRMYL